MITHGILLLNVSSHPPQLHLATFLFHKGWKQLLYFKSWYSCYSLHNFYNAIFNANTTFFENPSFSLTLFTINIPVLSLLPLSNCMNLLKSNLYLLSFSCFFFNPLSCFIAALLSPFDLDDCLAHCTFI